MKYIFYFLVLFSSFQAWTQQEETLQIQLPDGHLEGLLTAADSTKPLLVILKKQLFVLMVLFNVPCGGWKN